MNFVHRYFSENFPSGYEMKFIAKRDLLIKSCEKYNTFSYLCNIYSFQLLSYYTAKKLGNDIDQPRNLAKSVTVE